MFDRVEICPHCGETDGIQLFSSSCPLDGFGGSLMHSCFRCRSVIAWGLLDWELSHRLLRRLMIRSRTIHGCSFPSLWRPLFDYDSMGLSQKATVRFQVSDAWVGFLPAPNSWFPDNKWKLDARLELEVVKSFLLATAVYPSYRALTVRDYLGFCFEHNHDFCFG